MFDKNVPYVVIEIGTNDWDIVDEYEFKYKSSLFSMKPILMNSEIDDSRPTVIRKYSKKMEYGDAFYIKNGAFMKLRMTTRD